MRAGLFTFVSAVARIKHVIAGYSLLGSGQKADTWCIFDSTLRTYVSLFLVYLLDLCLIFYLRMSATMLGPLPAPPPGGVTVL